MDNPVAADIRAAGGIAGEGRGPAPYTIMVVGEAPGPTEAKKGRPFIGPAGKLLDSMCKDAGVTSYYVTNACKVFPGWDKHKKIRSPNVAEIEQWKWAIDAEIAYLEPEVIVLLGASACRLAFPGQWKLGNIVGQTVEKEGRKYVAAWHPASFLYNQGTSVNAKRMNQQRRILTELVNPSGVQYNYTILPPRCQAGMVFLDCETHHTGVDPRTAKILEWAQLVEGDDKATLAFDPATLPPIPDTVVFHNAMFDYPLLLNNDPKWAKVTDIHDTMLLASVQGYTDLSLKGLSNQLFGTKVYDYSDRETCGPEQYNAQDVFLTQRLFWYLYEQNTGKAYDTDRALIPILTHASLYGGYHIDKKRFAQVIEDTEIRRAELLEIFEREFGNVNINSPEQVKKLFPHLRDTKAETLRAEGSMAAALIVEYRKLSIALRTFLYPCKELPKLSGLYNLVHGSDDDMDEDTGTATGRLSSHDRNMQNLHPVIQQCLLAPTGMEIVRGDYSQIELRVAAEMSQAPFLVAAMRDGLDLHQGLLDYMTDRGVRLPNGRLDAKRLNFGTLYGAGDGRLQQLLNCSKEEAATVGKHLREYWADFFDWATWRWGTVQVTGQSVGMAPWNHVRTIWTYNNKSAEKQATNHPIQNGAGYITKEAMLTIGNNIGVREFANQIHDELHYFVEKGDKKGEDYIKEAMIETAKQYLPTVGVDVAVARSRRWEPK